MITKKILKDNNVHLAIKQYKALHRRSNNTIDLEYRNVTMTDFVLIW